ncbi:hypothetical protein L1049_025894 [Liquidambar formosana]|uniref:RST domain-containing protein n=1 Tax=Liquidambar formosana TaxID=63359 RepID=A0AAP0R8Q6_LIQFO
MATPSQRDETMHSGADVEAFTAALNRDIEGDTSAPRPSDSDNAVLSQGSNQTSSQLFPQWQTSSQDENVNGQSQHDQNSLQQQEQHSTEMELKQHGSGAENQQQQYDTSQELNRLPLKTKQSEDEHQQQQAGQIPLQFFQPTGMQISGKNPIPIQEPGRMHNPDSESQYSKLQKMNNQQVTATEQASNLMNRGKQVPFALLLPVILPQLEKDKAMQLQTLYARLRKNEIPKEGFVRHMRDIVGDQMLRLAVIKLTQGARNSQTGPNQFQLQSQASTQQHNLKMQSISARPFTDPQSFAQLHQKGHSSSADPSQVASSEAQGQTDSSYLGIENPAKKSQVERQSDSHGTQVSQMSSSSSLNPANQERERSTIPIQGLNKQQQQHLHFSQSSFPMYGSTGGNYHPYSGTNVNASASSLRPQHHDSQMRQVPLHPNMASNQLGGPTQAMNAMSVTKFERQSSVNDPKRVQGGSFSQLANNSTLQQNSVPWQSATNKENNNGALSSMTYVKQEPADQANEQQHKSQLSTPQGLSSISAMEVEQGNAISGALKDESSEKQSSRMSFPTSMSTLPANAVSSSMTTQLEPNVSLGSRIPSVTSPAGINARTPPKKPSVGQKKPLEALGSSPPLSSKKQKVSGAFLDQSIEQLNDVTACQRS